MRTRTEEESGGTHYAGPPLYKEYFESVIGVRQGRQCFRISCVFCPSSWFGYVFKPEQRRFACYWHIRVRHPKMLAELFPDGEP